jgi:hypothetical protein
MCPEQLLRTVSRNVDEEARFAKSFLRDLELLAASSMTRILIRASVLPRRCQSTFRKIGMFNSAGLVSLERESR